LASNEQPKYFYDGISGAGICRAAVEVADPHEDHGPTVYVFSTSGSQ
jgi:hypothetical protein